jgi:3-hydroxyanthranilate 3,4-dioxygenase
MSIANPFNFKVWIEENRHLLKPPVGNKCIYTEAEDFIVMVVGGPNQRRDFHYNESEEFFYQLEGDMVLRIIEDGVQKDVSIKEGDIYLLPPKIPHSPQRPENTIGLVIEKVRSETDKDGFLWFCENCDNKLYDEYFKMEDIVAQLPPIMNKFYSSKDLRTCKECGTEMSTSD